MTQTLALIRNAILRTTLILFAATAHAVPGNIDHQPWDALLRAHVDERGLVDYQGWRNDPAAMNQLDAYIKTLGTPTASVAQGDDEIATLINAYNAFVIHLILTNFPTESIRQLDNPFDAPRNLLGNEMLSLDEIEHQRLRPLIGWKAHAVVVCAARSCPPLLNGAYFAEDWEDKMAERYTAWLARPDLNRYHPEKNEVEISKIFDWYDEDFRNDPTVKEVLYTYGPTDDYDFLKGGYRIRYLDYHWGLNAQSDLGENYRHSFWNNLF